MPGVTRDRNYGISKYHGYEFIAIDTGGFEPVAESSLRKQMVQQARLRLKRQIVFYLSLTLRKAGLLLTVKYTGLWWKQIQNCMW